MKRAYTERAQLRVKPLYCNFFFANFMYSTRFYDIYSEFANSSTTSSRIRVGSREKTVHYDATSSNLKGKHMTKTIGFHHCLQQFTKHVPATDEASVHRAQLRVKSLYCNFFFANFMYSTRFYDTPSSRTLQLRVREFESAPGKKRQKINH